MVALCIIMAVLIVIVIILLIPVGAETEYDESGVTVWLRIGAVKKILYPRPLKSESKEKAQKKKKEKEPKEEQPKKGGTLRLITELIPVGIEALGRFKRGIIVKMLKLYFCFGGDDPVKTAISFGGASAGAGMIVPLLRQNFRIREIDIRNSVDFTSPDTRVYAHADIRIRLITVVAIAASAGVKVLKILIGRKKDAKAEQPAAEAEKGR